MVLLSCLSSCSSGSFPSASNSGEDDAPPGTSLDAQRGAAEYSDPDQVESGAQLAGDVGDRDLAPDATSSYQPPLDAGPSEDVEGPELETQEGLIAYWTFDDDPRVDIVGHYDAVCGPLGCPETIEGIDGRAIDVRPSTAQHLRVADEQRLPLTSAFSVASWVKYRTLEGRTCTFTKPIVQQDNVFALCANGNKPYSYVCGARCTTLASSAAVELGVWIHLAATYDGTTYSFYVDGARVASNKIKVRASSASLVIGGDDDGSFCHSTDGVVDEVRLYDRALSEQEVLELATR